MEILVVRGRQPARVCSASARVQARGSASSDADEMFWTSRYATPYGMIAVFMWPLWLIRWRMTSRRFGKRLFAIDEITGRDVSTGYGLQRLADVHRRVMEARLAGNFRVMQQRGVQRDVALVRASAEEIDRAAAAQHAHRQLPGLGFPTASIAMSTPRPLVRSLTACTTSCVGAGVQQLLPRPCGPHAPTGSAAGRSRSRERRRSFARRTNIRPIGPSPITAT